MKKKWDLALAIGLATLMGACSSSPSNELGDDELPAATDAATDAVPQDMLENPLAEGKGDVPPPSDAPVEPPTDPALAGLDTPPAPTDAPPVEAAPPAAPAEAPPAPVPAPVADSSGSGESSGGGKESYRVQSGDTLMKIAFETYGDLFKWRNIYDWNRGKISDPNSIPVGTVLKLEGGGEAPVERNGDKYLIKKGDTLGSISEDIYGTRSKWKKLWENNKQLIRNPNRIFAGFYLYYTLTPEEREHKQVAPAPLAQEQESAPAPVEPQAQAPTPVQQMPTTPDQPLAAPPPAAALNVPSQGSGTPQAMGAPAIGGLDQPRQPAQTN